MTETIHDVLYWEITNLVQHIKDAFPNHNQLPWVDAAVCKLIDARKDLFDTRFRVSTLIIK